MRDKNTPPHNKFAPYCVGGERTEEVRKRIAGVRANRSVIGSLLSRNDIANVTVTLTAIFANENEESSYKVTEANKTRMKHRSIYAKTCRNGALAGTQPGIVIVDCAKLGRDDGR